MNSFEFRYGGGESLCKFVFGYSADTAGQEHFFHPGQFENTLEIELLYVFESRSFYGQTFKIKIPELAIVCPHHPNTSSNFTAHCSANFAAVLSAGA